MEVQYKIWRDRGDNLGIQCLVCNRTFWTGLEPTTDPTTGIPCSNCELIKSQNILDQEKQAYQQSSDGSSEYPISQPLQTSASGEVLS